MTLIVKLHERPRLNNPVLVCGLPGSGFVAKLAVDHLVKELGASKFGEIYSHAFPPQVVIRNDGSVDLMKSELYYWRRGHDGGSDMVVYTGDSQPSTPEAEYEMADKVLEIVQDLTGKRVFTLAAYITGAFVDKPKVYGTATDPEGVERLKQLGVLTMGEGSITGMNGLLVGLARVRGMSGICILGETSGYIVDAKASRAVLEILNSILSINVPMTTLEERARETESVVKTIVEEMRRGQQQQSQARPSARDLGYIS